MATYDELTEQMGGMDPFDGPTPGESLTDSPDTPRPYEQPPVHTDLDTAVEDMFMRMTDPSVIDEFLDLMRDGVPVENIAQVSLFEGFRQGQFTPDLMLNMIEPTIYILLYLADYADIDAVLYPEGEEKSNGPMPKYVPPEVPAEDGPAKGVVEDREGIQMARPRSVKPSMLESLSKKKEMTDGN